MYIVKTGEKGIISVNLYEDTLFFIRIQFIRISRLRFGSIFLTISINICLEIYLTVQEESFHPEMQFKAIFEGGRGRKFEK